MSYASMGRFGISPPEVTTPTECKTVAQIRVLLVAAGYKVPAPLPDEQADSNAVLPVLKQFAADRGLDPKDSATLCAALIEAAKKKTAPPPASPPAKSWWEKQSQETKMAIGIGGAALVGYAIYSVSK